MVIKTGKTLYPHGTYISDIRQTITNYSGNVHDTVLMVMRKRVAREGEEESKHGQDSGHEFRSGHPEISAGTSVGKVRLECLWLLQNRGR